MRTPLHAFRYSAFRQRMDQLNRYCREKRLEPMLRRQLREYLIRVRHVQAGDSQRELMTIMSPKLQGLLSLQVNGTWLTAVRFLRPLQSKPGAETACCVRIVLALEARVYIPTELLPADSMYHLNSGTVIHRGAVIVSGKTWGDDCILHRVDLRPHGARGLTYVEVEQIHRDTLLKIILTSVVRTSMDGGSVEVHEYPSAVRRLRWHAVMVGMIRECARLRGSRPGQSKSRDDVYRAWSSTFEAMESGDTRSAAEEAAPMPARQRSRLMGDRKASLKSHASSFKLPNLWA